MSISRKLSRNGQMSEAFCTAMFLSVSGGLQDVYTYLYRGKVFANAQTGNIVLCSVKLFEGDWSAVLHYLVPLCFFALGVFTAELLRQKFQQMQRLHWRQLVVLCEIVMLFVVGFFPQEWNLVANALVIANLRSGLDSVCSGLGGANRAARCKAFHYFAIILLFALGAGLGSVALGFCGAKAIWFSCLLLAVSFCLMFLKEDIEELEEDIEKLEAKH